MKRLLSKLTRILFLFGAVLQTIVRYPGLAARSIILLPEFCRGLKIADNWGDPLNHPGQEDSSINPLWEYFSQYRQGPGIWKWTHYFEAYHRHFERFRGQQVNLLEIGIYSGGSLPMWLSYFGDNCKVFGVDIEEVCKSYETDRIKVYIGDQEDREFWKRFREEAPEIHILIDDGGHTPEQQMTTLEEMLPYMPPGSVYMCEDIHGNSNSFAAFATALVHRLNAINSDGQPGVAASQLQQSLHSIHFYPYLCVIEKHRLPPQKLIAPKHGTEWQPFL